MRIFVYGSLRHKQGNSHWITNAQLLAISVLITTSCIALGHYPGAVPGTEQYMVKFIVLTTPRWPNLMPCAPGAVNTRAS
ncbi:gamma-glutamylcyclotransferase [Shigella sonnei]